MPKTHLWAVAEERFIGRISIHHELNDVLRLEGGHIGYDTVPSFRGRGVAREMLRQGLLIARALGLTEVLLTCDDANAASIRVIERNSGSLRETKAPKAEQTLEELLLDHPAVATAVSSSPIGREAIPPRCAVSTR